MGGDLYDIARLDDGRLFIVIGDVSGKGVAASLFMAVSKTLCKSTALRGSLSAYEILTLANRDISRENPELLFVTTVMALVNTTTGEIDVVNAGHAAPAKCSWGSAAVCTRRLLLFQRPGAVRSGGNVGAYDRRR